MMPTGPGLSVPGISRTAYHPGLTQKKICCWTFAAPKRDRYQVIHNRKPGRIIAEDMGVGFERTDAVVIIQIIQQGRTEAQQRPSTPNSRSSLGS